MSKEDIFIPLEEALKYGHTEEELNTIFEKTVHQNGVKLGYSLLELEYYKETGKYPSFPLDGWGAKPFDPKRNNITNFPIGNDGTTTIIHIESRSGKIINGIRV